MTFLIAPHLAFLVQWLRILGVDVRLWENDRLSAGEGEVVVQWAPYPLPLAEKSIEKITLFSAGREDLLKEFFRSSGIRPDVSQMFKRCLRCNQVLIPLNPEEAKAKWPDLPPYVYQTQKKFNWCDHCRQLFWAGTHVGNMIRTLEDWGVIPPGFNSEGSS